MRRLFDLSLHNEKNRTARLALLQVGAVDPHTFIRTIGDEAVRADRSSRHHRGALVVFAQIVRKFGPALVDHVIELVKAVVRTLDPDIPLIREACMKESSAGPYAPLPRLVYLLLLTPLFSHSLTLCLSVCLS